jgi:hypothetical protein
MRTDSGVEVGGGAVFNRAGGGVAGRGGVRGFGGGDVASAAAPLTPLTGRSGDRTRCGGDRRIEVPALAMGRSGLRGGDRT